MIRNFFVALKIWLHKKKPRAKDFLNSPFFNTLMTFIVGVVAVCSAIFIASKQNDLTKNQLQLSQAVVCGVTMSNNVFNQSKVVSIPMLTRDSYPIPLPIQTNCDGSQDYNVIAHVQDYIGNNYTITLKLTVTSQDGYLSYTAYLQNIEPDKAPTF